MNSNQQQMPDFSSERFARISRMMASLEGGLRPRSSEAGSGDGSADVIEKPCRLAPAVLRRRRVHQ